MKKQLVVLMLCLLLAFSLVVMAGAEEPDGSFVLAVCTANNIVIEPVRIPYTSGQTIKDAILNSGYVFEGLEERDYIDSIEGVAANYRFFYDNNGFNLKIPASDITALWIGVSSVKVDCYEDMLSMIRKMAEYSEMSNHVQNYKAADSAYKRCLNAMRGDGSLAAERQEALNSAITAYEEILNGPRFTLSVTAKQGETPLATSVITMTDAYGNVTTSIGNTIDVIAGDYTFSVSDGGYNRTEGQIKIWKTASISVDLPNGEWFGEMYMRSYYWLTGYADPYRLEQNSTLHRTTIWVDDAAEGYYATNLVVHIGDVPDEQTTLLRTIYTSLNGEDYSEKARSWTKNTGTFGNFLDSLVSEGLEGRIFNIEGQYLDNQGYTQIQSYEIEIIRVPTLKTITVVGDGTLLPTGNEPVSQGNEMNLPVGYSVNRWDLYVTTVSELLDYSAIPFQESYTVTGLGSFQVQDGESTHEITVTAENGATGTYTVHISKTDSCIVTINAPEGTDFEIRNAMNTTIAPVDGVYYLIPEMEYSYHATKAEYYHTSESFIACNGLVISVVEPIVEDWLLDFEAHSQRRVNATSVIEASTPFSADGHLYSYYFSDCNSMVYLKATTTEGTAYAYYIGQTDYVVGNTRKVEITSKVGDNAVATSMSVFLATGGYSNTMTIQVEKEENEVLYYQDYILSFFRAVHLYDLTVTTDEDRLLLQDSAGNITDFDRDDTNYTVTVNRDIDNITISGVYPVGQMVLSPDVARFYGGYYARINDNDYNEIIQYRNSSGMLIPEMFLLAETVIPLDIEKDEEIISIEVCHSDATAQTETYTLMVKKTDPVPVVFQTTPADAVVYLTNDTTGKRVFDNSGVYMLTPEGSYSYSITYAGYRGIQGQYIVPEQGGTLTINLDPAPVNTSLVNLSAEWPHLRQDNNNNAVVNYPTPTKSDETVLYWATKLGEGFDSDACSPPILVDGFLYTYSGTTLYKIDKNTGQVVASAAMAEKSSFAINPPTYANGMIFVGLAGGRVQAFNAATLESLWVFADPTGGQPNCSIVYHDGYIYTGFWRGENVASNYVCISATDEDPSQTNEVKLATWTHTAQGGFYWAGAYVCDDFVLVGTDDGETSYTKGHPSLLSLDTKTGKMISESVLPETGDIRSSITYYGGKYYFTCKGGYFFEASVNSNGVIQNVKSLKLNNYTSDSNNPPMSTSTPTIYNGRAYIGVCGTGQFGTYSGHNITVVDIGNWEIAYSVRTKGYPQSSGVLTTAYEKETKKVYVYFVENFTPGILRVLEDSEGQTSPSLTTIERGLTTAYNLFQPVGSQAQYAICSPIMDANGTMYFKNDSGYLMAVGSTLELEVVSNPEKLTYMAGEEFDSTGLQVIAHYANGLTRDVTKYLTWSTEPLTADDTDFQLRYPIVMYQNVVEDGQVMAGVEYAEPMAVVTLTIDDSQVTYGDVNGDGKVNRWDARAVVQYYNDEISLTDYQFLAADVDGNGKVNKWDYRYIVMYYNDEISEFPVQTKISHIQED